MLIATLTRCRATDAAPLPSFADDRERDKCSDAGHAFRLRCVNLTGLQEQEPGSEPVTYFDGVGRVAFAPGTTDGGIRISPVFEESPIAEVLEKDVPFGNYWMLFKRETETE